MARLHIGYETCEEYPLDIEPLQAGEPKPEHYRIGTRAMRFADEERTVLIFNDQIRLTGIPDEAHRYQINGRTPLEWLIDRYRVMQDKQSGIVNDPNAWFDNPRGLIVAIRRSSKSAWKRHVSSPAFQIPLLNRAANRKRRMNDGRKRAGWSASVRRRSLDDRIVGTCCRPLIPRCTWKARPKTRATTVARGAQREQDDPRCRQRPGLAIGRKQSSVAAPGPRVKLPHIAVRPLFSPRRPIPIQVKTQKPKNR